MKKRTISVIDMPNCILEVAHDERWSCFVVCTAHNLHEVFIHPAVTEMIATLGVSVAGEVVSEIWGSRVRDNQKNEWRRRFSDVNLDVVMKELAVVQRALSGKKVDVWYAELPAD